MAPKYDPWNPPRRGNPKKESPAFQREWQPVESSGVLIDNAASQVLIQPPSGVGVSGTITDDLGNIISVAMGNAAGPMFLQLSTPIKVPINCGVQYNRIIYKAGSLVTCYYTVSTEPYETPYTG